MKYGIRINAETEEIDLSHVRSFTNAHWKAINKRERSGWVQFPWRRVFISFCNDDRKLMNILHEEIYISELLNPIIVEATRKGGTELASLVMKEIHDADYFIPILSKNSLKAQWVNQEIGFAKGIPHLKINPIVEQPILNTLKGFVHNQLQISYLFRLRDRRMDDWDIRNFTNMCKELVRELEEEIITEFKIVRG